MALKSLYSLITSLVKIVITAPKTNHTPYFMVSFLYSINQDDKIYLQAQENDPKYWLIRVAVILECVVHHFLL